MKTAYFLIALLLTSHLTRGEEKHYEKVQCGKDTVVLFERLEASPNGRYALGWTVRPVSKNTKPVDWSQLDKKGPRFADDYDFRDNFFKKLNGQPKRLEKYHLTNGIIDRENHIFTEFPTENAIDGFLPFQNHVSAKWFGSNFAIVTLNTKFSTLDLFLLTMEKDKITMKNLVEEAKSMVNKVMAEESPLSDMKALSFYCHVKDISKNENQLTLPFYEAMPRFGFEQFDGELIVKLPHGHIVKATIKVPEDRPFVGNLGKADKKLNKLYRALREKLSGNSLRKLKAEQSKWIEERNAFSVQIGRLETSDSESFTLSQYRQIRNQKALELTNERILILQRQLDSLVAKTHS